MTIREVLVLLPLTLLPVRADAAVVVPDDVTIRVYDSVGLPPDVLAPSLAVARATLAAAGLHAGWDRCPAAERCARPPAGRELVLRLVSGGPQDVRAHAATLLSGEGLPLGEAFVDTGRRAGVLATIYVDRVRLLAATAGSDAASLLGYAIAHEIGHLLLGSNGHGSRGLMRALWNAADLRRGRTADWRFTPAEAAALRRRVGR